MEITLSPELELILQQQMATGKFQNADEVFSEALYALRDRQELSGAELEDLRREIQLGIDDIERGDYEEWDDMQKLAEDIHRRGMARLEAERSKRA